MKPLSISGCICFVALIAAVPADAATLIFTLTGSRSAVFQLDSNPVPDVSSSSFVGKQVQFNNVAGTFGGVAGVASSISFGTDSIAALNINGTILGFTQFAGPALFTGPATAPVFAPGTFQLTSIVSGASTLTITQAAAAGVPEPASWALMIGGFGLAGAVLRRRTARVAFG